MKRALVIAFLGVAMMVPGVASATVLTGVTATGDCDGWSIEVSVHWAAPVYQANLHYIVNLTDLDGNILETVEFEGVLTRPQGAPQNTVHLFTGMWEGIFQAPGFMVTGMVNLIAPYNNTTIEFSEIIDCVVAEEGISWSTLKANYR